MSPTDTQTNKTLVIQIEKLVQGGKGLAHDGSLAIFVPRVLPDETVRVQTGPVRKGYAEGRLIEVIQPSSDRVPPPCPVYGICGGCHVQHAGYQAQLSLKRDILTETLRRVGGVNDLEVPPLLPSPRPFGYRGRARLAVQRSSHRPASLAYFEEGSHRLVAIEGCPLLVPRLNEAVAHLNRLLAMAEPKSLGLQEVRLSESSHSGDVVIHYSAEQGTREQAEKWFEHVRTGAEWVKGQVLVTGRGPHGRRWTDGETTLTERLMGMTFRFSDRAFAQANWPLNETVVSTVTAWTFDEAPATPIRILELYAGAGNFGLPLARAGALVTLVEGNSAALADARYNARVNHVGRCRFRSGSAEEVLAASTPGEYDLIVLDPPRSGLSKEALAGLIRLKPGRIVYLSCDPPTLARDLRAVRDAGYRATRLQGFDMFPQTMHIETVVELVQV
jgi:23S rRNA (uracil1939-C5)-methyltransferase